MHQEVKKFNENVYQIDVFMEGKSNRMSCYFIDSSNPILIEVGPSKSFPYLISGIESLGINNIRRSAITHLHLDHVGGIGHLVEKYKNHFVYVHELGLKHLPNPERLWKAVANVYSENWLLDNWGIIKPTPIDNIIKLNDDESIDLGGNRKLKTIYSPGHAKHHFTFYDNLSKTIFMGDALGLIYPHGDFVQPNLPPPDFNKELLINTLTNIKKLDLEYIALAHFGIHSKPYELIDNAIKNIELWVSFIKKLPELNNSDAAIAIEKWVKNNYKVLNIDDYTINNYILSSNFEMQVIGIRDYLNKIKKPLEI